MPSPYSLMPGIEGKLVINETRASKFSHANEIASRTITG